MNMSSPKTKVIILFVEGYTEVDFYKALITDIRALHGEEFCCNIEYKNMKGVGNYKNDALRRLGDVKRKYPESDIYAFLCYDTDAFRFSRKPPVDMKEVRKQLLANGAKKVDLIEANKSIEDWFLYDFDGVKKYLRLSERTPKESGTGQDVIKKLFKKAKRVYVKGDKLDGFIEKLNIPLIRVQVCSNLRPLCKCLGLDCKKICNKQSSSRQ